MILFITGCQEADFIQDTLTELHEDFCITKIVGSACSPCMTEAARWCDEMYVPIDIFLPEDFSVSGSMKCNRDALIKSNPHFVLVYDENRSMQKMICNIANKVDSVEYIAQKEQ